MSNTSALPACAICREPMIANTISTINGKAHRTCVRLGERVDECEALKKELKAANKMLWGAVHNAGRGRHKGIRWGHLTDILAVGSTSAYELCVKHKADPNLYVGDDACPHLCESDADLVRARDEAQTDVTVLGAVLADLRDDLDDARAVSQVIERERAAAVATAAAARDVAHDYEKERDEAITEAEGCVTELRALEWQSSDTDYAGSECPSCRATKYAGVHAADCVLAELIKAPRKPIVVEIPFEPVDVFGTDVVEIVLTQEDYEARQQEVVSRLSSRSPDGLSGYARTFNALVSELCSFEEILYGGSALEKAQVTIVTRETVPPTVREEIHKAAKRNFPMLVTIGINYAIRS